jgi:hypothetical protein
MSWGMKQLMLATAVFDRYAKTEALTLAERIGDPFSLEVALLQNATLRVDRGEPELALQRLAAAETLPAEQRLGFAQEPQFLRDAALIAQGAFAEAITCLRRGLPAGLARRGRVPMSSLN